MQKLSLLIILILSATLAQAQQAKGTLMQVPGNMEYTHIDTAGRTVLPSGRYVTPAGQTIRIAHDPFGMAVSPDGIRSVTLHNGSFTVIDNRTLNHTQVGGTGDIPGIHKNDTSGLSSLMANLVSPLPNGSFLGVAFGRENNIVYLSGGDNGSVIIYDIDTFRRLDSLSLNGVFGGVMYDDSFTSDLVFSSDLNQLLVLDRGNFRMVRIDLSTRKIVGSIPTGRQPFGLSLSPDQKTAFVANVGMYDYPVLPDLTPKNYDSLLLPWHPYGNGTPEAINGYIYNGRKVPGVGSPTAPEAMSVYAIDLATNIVTDRYKPGYQIGEMVEDAEVVGGASPNSLAVGSKYAYVTNATNDNISIIDYRAHKIIGAIPIKVDPALDKFRGLLPFGITLSRDEKTLYVALLGFNAVAVVDVASKKTLGLIPSGWGPTRVRLSKDEKDLYIISCRGYGAGPNGGPAFIEGPNGTYIGDIQLGTFQKVPMPDSKQLASLTARALDNTRSLVGVKDDGTNPLPPMQHMRKSPIKYIVYITKENRTYDEVLGQLETGKGEPSLARFGNDINFVAKDKTLAHISITPNHTKIARQFSYSDNFYCDSDASIHGHHWMMGVIPNEWVEANSNTDKTAKPMSKASGRRFPGSTGSMDPEDYAERGGIWEAMERSKIPFYNFGEANETAHNREDWVDTATGGGHGVMVPMQKALWPRTSHNYAGFNMNIPDQFRMQQFESEFTRLWLKSGKPLPRLITMQVPNDHTSGPRPQDGYPYPHSFVADNDLALGRILHFLSRTPYWKNMLVVVTEDDPQGGVDHVDAHRSLLLLAGPYVKKGYTSHTHANFGSILRMIYTLLDVPFVNQYDATATLLTDLFTAKPDYTPYSLEMPSKEVFDPEVSMKKYHRGIDWRSIMKGPEMDDVDDMRKMHKEKK